MVSSSWWSPFFSSSCPALWDKPRDNGAIVRPRRLAPALPDQNQAERSQRRAVSGPLDLFDHETRCRPGDHAGALADPQCTDREREQADDQKQFAHGVFLGCVGLGALAQRPEWRARSPGARAER